MPAQKTRYIPSRISARDTFAAFKYRNYRLWFIGQVVSLVGTWMQSTAQGYLVYELTQSSAYLGVVSFAYGVPAWFFNLYGGVVADRVPRRIMLIITQSAQMILAFILAWLTFTGLVQPWHIVILAFFLGVANAFDAPARQSFVLEMVTREDLTNAIALNSIMFNSAIAIGPAVAGIAYAVFGPDWCFIINGISYLAVIIALAMMRIPWKSPERRRTSFLTEIREGFGFVVSSPIARTLILNLFMVSLLGMGFVTLLPAWSVKQLGGDSTTYGFLQSARGVGAVFAGLLLAVVSSWHIRGKLFSTGSIVFPIMLAVFTFMRALPLSIATLLCAGWGQVVMFNTSNSMLQSITPDELRGRVMGIYTLSFFGVMPVGALIAGQLAEMIGEPPTIMIGVVSLLVTALFIIWRVPELGKME
ncbi:MAG: MFS transporter [Anaerolineales bacterium]|nr:MFS transporter [Anaerolineales bacterium]